MKRFTSILLTIAMLMSLVPTLAFAADNSAFNDVQGTEYYAEQANALSQLNVLAGYEDGSFGADKSITRAEMAAIVCRMIEKEDEAQKAQGETKFDDVNKNHWASGYINIASDEKIISGDGNGKFRPEDDVKYEEAIKMVVCALGFGEDVKNNASDWSAEYISIAKEKGITNSLEGSKGKASTRGDIAVMVYNGMKTDVSVPIASLTAGSYTGTKSVTLTTAAKNADIYYTIDGSIPTTKSIKYTKAISISKTSTLKAITVKNGILTSDVLSAEYTIKRSGGGGGSSRPSTYTLSFANTENGIVETSVAGNYAVNSSINLLATANEGYVFSEWKTDNGGTFADKNSATTTFTMPSNNVIISAIFVVKEEISVEIQTLFGTDPEKEDTDGDGLSDYIEIYKSGTDPTLVDSDENGVVDADEDLDNDGLTNIQEVRLGTNLAKADSDNDGLSDYDEVNIHKTNPCNFDTDGDGLSDGDEILFGLNPLVDKTDGVTLDSERKFEQNVSKENISEELLSEDNDAIPSLTVLASGNINRSVEIEKTSLNDFSDSRAIVGEAVDLTGADISEGTLSFKVSDGISLMSVEDSDDSYNTNLICKYNNDGTTDYLDTLYDTASGTVSADISGDGTYYVMDVKALFDELGLSLPTVADLYSLEDEQPVSPMSMSEETLSEANNNNSNTNNSVETADKNITLFSSATAIDDTIEIANADKEKVTLMASSGAMAQADIVFVIDTTGSMSDEISNVKNNVGYFVDALKAKGISAGLALVEYRDIEEDGYDSTKVHKNGASNWFYDMDAYKNKIASSLYADGGGDTPESVVDALETSRLLDMRASAGKMFILVTDANYKTGNRYGIPSMSAEIELLKNAGVNCSVVTSSSEQSTYYNLYNETSGIYANINGNFYNELMTIADKIGEEIVGDGYWIYLQGPVPVPVRLDEIPTEGSSVDTDKDGVPDVEELEGATPTGEVNLDEIITKVSRGTITGTDYGVVKTYKYKSSPAETDTDFDGIDDLADEMPNSNSFKGIMHYSLDGTKKTCNVEFSMDYRNLIDGNNKKHSKNLSELSIMYASDVYEDLYIELTDGAKGGNDSATTFGNLLGLKDTKCIKINSSDYLEDKDDITEFFIGHKNIRYNGSDNEVIVVSVRGTNGTNAEWSSNFDVGADCTEYYNATGNNHPDWKNKDNHKGFDVASNRVLEKISDYISAYVNDSSKKYILVTGHSRGAAIANILGKEFEDDTNYKSFTYTFAAPNSTTASNANSYSTIFNVINEDDIIPYLPISEWSFKNYGITKSISVEKHYENKWWTAQKGTWEWLIGVDYNNDGGTQRTLDCFSKISNCRENLYKLDTSSDGTVWENNLGYVTYAGAETELTELKQTLENEKLLKFCTVKIVGGGISYHVEVNYCPAYLMQSLCNMTTGTGPRLGHDVKGKYASAKASFVASSGKVVVGGMTHPHMQPTYYLIVHNDFKAID